VSYSELATPAATIAVLQRHGLYTRKSLGQHFLVDDNVIGRILALARVRPEDVVLEVGPGIGTLTVALARVAAAVVAVETDRALVPVLARTTAAGPAPVRVLEADATTVPAGDLVSVAGQAPDLLVANLPYSVAATVVLRFLQEVPSIRSATVMVQAEVADRMLAAPGSRVYGGYTVKLGLVAEAAGRFGVSRGSFLPPPRVDSAVVRLDRREWPGADAATIAAAGEAADAAFAQRRKTLRNSMASALGVPPDEVERALLACGIDPGARAEALDTPSYLLLGAEFAARGLLGGTGTATGPFVG
jgi:16S rRNA (adenine1518-N6/adenine1519-N6)-dimethyltransferase